MKKPLVIAAFVLLAGCVTPPPITDTNDAFAESYATINTMTGWIASGERNQLLTHAKAVDLYKRIRNVNDGIYQAQALKDPVASKDALATAQAILKGLQKELVQQGVNHE